MDNVSSTDVESLHLSAPRPSQSLRAVSFRSIYGISIEVSTCIVYTAYLVQSDQNPNSKGNPSEHSRTFTPPVSISPLTLIYQSICLLFLHTTHRPVEVSGGNHMDRRVTSLSIKRPPRIIHRVPISHSLRLSHLYGH